MICDKIASTNHVTKRDFRMSSIIHKQFSNSTQEQGSLLKIFKKTLFPLLAWTIWSCKIKLNISLDSFFRLLTVVWGEKTKFSLSIVPLGCSAWRASLFRILSVPWSGKFFGIKWQNRCGRWRRLSQLFALMKARRIFAPYCIVMVTA